MSFKCPANYIEGKNKSLYDSLVSTYILSVHPDDKPAINNYIKNADNSNNNLPSFLKSGVLPSSLNSDSTPFSIPELRAIIKSLTRKITSCSTAFKSTESYTIISKLEYYFGTNNITSNLIKVLYLMSYLIIIYLGYNYITNKMFGGADKSIPTYFASYKGISKMIYYLFIICIPITMIALLISNKVNVSFNVSIVLIYFSLALIVLIGFVKTVASKSFSIFLFLMFIVFGLSWISGLGMYYWSGKSVKEVQEDNEEGEKKDSWFISIFPIAVIAFAMIILVKNIGGQLGMVMAILIFFGLIAAAFTITFTASKYKNKIAFFYFGGILIPFIGFSLFKRWIYSNSGVPLKTAISVAVYVGLKIAIFSGLLTLGVYKMYKTSAEIKRAKRTETTASESPYYPITKPINVLMYVYYIILGLIGLTILIVLGSHLGILSQLNSLPRLQEKLRAPDITAVKKAKIQDKIDNITNGKTNFFSGLDFSYVMAVVIIMSLIISYNGTFAIWLPFILIPVGLLERGVATTIINTLTKNVSKEVADWQPVGSYLIEALIKMFTFTPLTDTEASNSGESKIDDSFLDTFGELNSTMFYYK